MRKAYCLWYSALFLFEYWYSCVACVSNYDDATKYVKSILKEELWKRKMDLRF